MQKIFLNSLRIFKILSKLADASNAEELFKKYNFLDQPKSEAHNFSDFKEKMAS
jgi:hypothetical protein